MAALLAVLAAGTFPSHMDVRHDVSEAGPGVVSDDDAEDAEEPPNNEKADTAATRQQAPPAARRAADDGWDDEDGKDENTPPRLGLLEKGYILLLSYSSYNYKASAWADSVMR